MVTRVIAPPRPWLVLAPIIPAMRLPRGSPGDVRGGQAGLGDHRGPPGDLGQAQTLSVQPGPNSRRNSNRF